MSQYASVCSTPRNNIKDKTFRDILFSDMSGDNITKPSLCDFFIDHEDIKKFIGKLSNSSAIGPDGVPTSCLKYGGQYIIDALYDLARSSIDESYLPKILKLAWITPIWKKTDRNEPADYRPISVTSHIGKVIERIIREQIALFLSSNGLYEDNQHGSRSGRSTLTQLLVQHDQLLDAMSNGKNCDVVFLDFSKAFDLVDHSLALTKIKNHGINGKILSWISEFLSDRPQRV